MENRIVPELPPKDEKLRVIIDTDVATEIDDLYAIALALYSPDRFTIEGLVGTHFANKKGNDSVTESYNLLHEILDVAGMKGAIPVKRGGDPLMYSDTPSKSEGADWIIQRAHASDESTPLWVVGIGAATNLASAMMIDPSIAPKVRYVFHSRSEQTWPKKNDQYNVYGDIWAARNLLTCGVPLVWFDTGAKLVCSMERTEKELVPLGGFPAYLHEFRKIRPYFQRTDKGFFDLGDIAWMMDPGVCTNDVVDAPFMNWDMRFRHDGTLGKMLRVYDIKPEPVWDLFFSVMKNRIK